MVVCRCSAIDEVKIQEWLCRSPVIAEFALNIPSDDLHTQCVEWWWHPKCLSTNRSNSVHYQLAEIMRCQNGIQKILVFWSEMNEVRIGIQWIMNTVGFIWVHKARNSIQQKRGGAPHEELKSSMCQACHPNLAEANRGHPFMTSTRRGSGSSERIWTGGGRVTPMSTQKIKIRVHWHHPVFFSCKEVGVFLTRISSFSGIKSGNFSAI